MEGGGGRSASANLVTSSEESAGACSEQPLQIISSNEGLVRRAVGVTCFGGALATQGFGVYSPNTFSSLSCAGWLLYRMGQQSL